MMATSHLSIFLLLALSSFTFASPVSHSFDISPRSQFSIDAPTNNEARKAPDPQPLPVSSQILKPRIRPPVRVNAPNSATYVVIDFGHAVAGSAITNLLTDAYDILYHQMQQSGDGLIPGGKFDVVLYGYKLLFGNGNNHQQTYGVVGSAIAAVFVYMTRGPGTPGTCSFHVFDGTNEVGWGQIEQAASL